MADTKALPVFAYIDDSTQLEELRSFLNKQGAKLAPKGSENTTDDLLEVVKQCGVIGKLDHDKEVEMILNSLSSLIVSVPEERVFDVVKAFCDQLNTQNFKGRGWASSAGAAVRVLSNLFVAFPGKEKTEKVQHRLWIALVAVCGESRLIGELDTSLDTLKKHFERWKLSVAEQREALRGLHTALLDDLRADHAGKVMVALLGTYTSADAPAAADDAAECVRTAIVDPKSFSFEHLLRLPPVKHLEKSAPDVFTALQLFASGSLKDYRAFVAKNPNFVAQKLKVDEEELVRKIRFLTLMSRAEKNNVVPLAELAKELELPDDESLEEFIIEAIQANAISGKLNEQTRELVVSSLQHRQFGLEQWMSLQRRIAALASNLKASYDNIHSITSTVNA